jgi:hypothetical protein
VIEPQLGAALQLSDQSTPEFVGSPTTVAATFANPPAANRGGGANVNVTAVTVDVMVTVAAELLL